MSSVPYIFANQTGNIPLSDLDANFANVKANVDYASYAGQANSASTATNAVTVTANAQPNITSVGSTLSVSGTITAGNISTTGQLSFASASTTGNIIGGNILTSGIVSGTGNAQFGNVRGFNFIASGGILTGNIASNTYVSGGSGSFTGNVIGGNLITTGKVQNTGLNVVAVNYANITANAATTSLSTTISRNILIANNTGYTHTINMPATPVDGQITNFAISGNTVILVVGTGTVSPTFAGSTTAGTAYTYVYRDSNTTWYRTN